MTTLSKKALIACLLVSIPDSVFISDIFRNLVSEFYLAPLKFLTSITALILSGWALNEYRLKRPNFVVGILPFAEEMAKGLPHPLYMPSKFDEVLFNPLYLAKEVKNEKYLRKLQKDKYRTRKKLFQKMKTF